MILNVRKGSGPGGEGASLFITISRHLVMRPKYFLKTLTANFITSFHVGNACCSYKAFE